MTLDYPNNQIDKFISAAKMAETRFTEISALLEAYESCRNVTTLANKLVKVAAETSFHAANDIEFAIQGFTNYISSLQQLEQAFRRKNDTP